jgi:hypothetical protein
VFFIRAGIGGLIVSIVELLCGNKVNSIIQTMPESGNCLTYAFDFLGIPYERENLCRGLRADELSQFFNTIATTHTRFDLLSPPKGTQAIAVLCNQCGRLGGDTIVGHMVVVDPANLPTGVVRCSYPYLDGIEISGPVLDTFPLSLFGEGKLYQANCYAFLEVNTNILPQG